MKKRTLAALMVVPVLAGALFVLAYTALNTTAGARWLLSKTEGRIPGTLEIAKVEGDLSSGLTLSQVAYRDTELAVGVERLRLAIDLDLFPLSIRISQAHIKALEIRQLTTKPGSTSLQETLSAIALPFPLELEELLVEKISLFEPDGSMVYTAKHLGAALGLGADLRVDRFFLESGDGRLGLEGNLGLSAPFPIKIQVDSRLAFAADPDPDSPQQSLDIRLNMEGELENQLDLEMTIDQPEINITGTLNNFAGDAEWLLNIESPDIALPRSDSGEAALTIKSLSANSQGWIDRFDLSAKGLLQTPDLEAHEFELLARGDALGLVITDLAINGAQLDLSAKGELNWQEGLEISMFSTLHRVNPGTWLSGWPEMHPLTGRIDFVLDQSGLELPGIHLEAVDTSMSLDGGGRMNLANGEITADVRWINFDWPLGSGDPDFRSPQGKAHLDGVFDDWKIVGETHVQASGLPEGTLKLEAKGDRNQASMTILDGRILGGEITGEATYDWSKNGQWSANLRSKAIQTRSLLPDWPATFSADVRAEGSTEPFRLLLDIRHLDGELRNVPLTAAGRMKMNGVETIFENLRLNFGESMIEFDGNPLSVSGLDFSARIENFASIIPDAGGSLQSSGHFSMLAGKPKLRLDLEAKNLVWEDFKAQTLSIHDAEDRAADALADLFLEAADLEVGGETLDRVSVNLKAYPENQSLRFSAQDLDLTLSGEVSGHFLENGEAMLKSGWTGHINSLEFSKRDRFSLVLQDPAPLEWSPDSAAVQHACLSAGANSSFCLDGEWERDKLLSAAIKLRKIPFSLAQPFFDTELEMTNTVDGEMDWNWIADRPSSGSAYLTISAGELRYPDDFDSLLKTGEGRLTFELDQGRLSAGKFYLPLPGMGEVDLDLNIPDLSDGFDAGIKGHIDVTLADLDVLTLFMPVIDQAGGRFSASLDLSGSVADPDFAGQLSLSDGLIRHHASGLRLNDIQLQGSVLNNDETLLAGSFRALDGTGQIEAKIDLADILSPRIEISLKGEQLKLFDAPDLTLVAEPDILLGWQAGVFEIEGSILIPSARIAPNFIPSTTITESADLVVVAGERTDRIDPEDVAKPIAIRGNLDVILGDKVELDLEHAEAEMTGSVNFAWHDELLPIANGQYKMVGQIHAYGQRLEVTEGTIGFPKVPADNPHLNIRAERPIYGNSEIRRAGVFVSGTLKRLVMEPFTDPMTNRDRARTLLITGSDFNMEQGVGAVDIGTYIAPKVFVSYGIGVFEDESVVSVRYDLGKRWGIKATSGQSQTGLDLSYTIEH